MRLSVIAQRSALFAAGFVFTSHVPAMSDPILIGAGDIASCGSSGDEETARLLDQLPGAIFTVGDNVYPWRRMRNPFPCYDASWGRHKSRTRPVPGNHEYEDGYADAYFDYFGPAAGERGKGYYSYDLGQWHIVALNTMIDAAPSSPQGKWLSRDLSQNRRFCTLAYFHHPRFSSGPHPTNLRAVDLWNALARGGVDVVISGHDHIYERFAPMTASRNVDQRAGMREFVVGTGGVSHYSIEKVASNSEVRNNTTFGVIRLVLHDRSYEWRFVPVRGGRFSDAGTGTCH
jgi:3',5'-cyclic AMP phosphodiesterase CpdA